MRPAGPALMECCQPLCSAGPERCPLPMVLTEAVSVSAPVSARFPGFRPKVLTEAVPVSAPVSVRGCPGFPVSVSRSGFGPVSVRFRSRFRSRFPPSFLPPFQGSTLFNS